MVLPFSKCFSVSAGEFSLFVDRPVIPYGNGSWDAFLHLLL